MAKFDLKNIKASSVQIQKDIDNTEKNRPATEASSFMNKGEKPIKAGKITAREPVESSLNNSLKAEQSSIPIKPTDEKTEKITSSGTKTVSITLPQEIKNYLRYQPRLIGTSISGFLSELIQKEQKAFDEKGIDLNKAPDFSKIPEAKTRQKGVKPVIVPVKMQVEQWQWLRRASIYSGLNVSQMVERLIREKAEEDGIAL